MALLCSILLGSLIADKARAIEPEMMAVDTLVPLFEVQPPCRFNPLMLVPAVRTSGLTIPMPSSRFHVAIPRDEKLATLVYY